MATQHHNTMFSQGNTPVRQIPICFRREDLIKRGYNPQVEELRATEYSYIKDAVYLDHSGATLYPTSFIDETSSILKTQLLGNPHSGSPSSMLATKHVEAVRAQVLSFFNADESHWDVVFVANATAAIKLVADSFSGYGAGTKKRGPGFEYRFHRDVHTSLVGVRELSSAWKCFETDEDTTAWLDGPPELPTKKPTFPCFKRTKPPPARLFAYPAQSNLTGRRLPLHWAHQARQKHGYFTLLDAAALLMTKPLDLSNPETSADYISLSFYKIFGMPDLGALLVKRGPAASMLQHRAYFGGGTVSTLLAHSPHHTLKTPPTTTLSPTASTTTLTTTTTPHPPHHPHDHLEDGSLPFHNILTLGLAIRRHTTLYGPPSAGTISSHTSILAHTLHHLLATLTHPNGAPVVHFYPSHPSTLNFLDTAAQGPVLAFNLLDPQGCFIGFHEVEARAAAENIHIRVGGNCNPGGVQWHCGFKEGELRDMFVSGGKTCGDHVDLVGGRPVGVVRVSLGAMTTWEDVRVFGEFVWRWWVGGGKGYEPYI